ncbi:MAG: hypothetical protein VX341_06500 [Bdellovibrionota bacterium]|nr:hypothetical protein [Bdellovibrionota bacterium]
MKNKILILSIFLSASINAMNFCPFNNKDTASKDILNSVEPIIQREMERIKGVIDKEEERCLLPSTEDVARTENLIRQVARHVQPPDITMQSLRLGNQHLNCTGSVEEFSDVLVNYIDFTLRDLPKLPTNYEVLQQRLTFQGQSGEKINQFFYMCFTEFMSKPEEEKNKENYKKCVYQKIYLTETATPQNINSEAYKIWDFECGQNIEKRSKALQTLLNEASHDELKLETTEQLVRNLYSQIDQSIDAMLEVDPSCSMSSTFINLANSLASAGLGLGELLGPPWGALGFNILTKPINALLNRLANRTEKRHLAELEKFYQLSNDDGGNRNQLMCSFLDMQSLKCDTIYNYDDHSDLCENRNIVSTNDASNIKKLIRSLQQEYDLPKGLDAIEVDKNNAFSLLDENLLGKITNLHDAFIGSAANLNPEEEGQKIFDELNLNELLFGWYEYYDENPNDLNTIPVRKNNGILEMIDKSSLSMSDRVALKRSEPKLKEQKKSLQLFSEAFQSFENSYSDEDAAKLINAYKKATTVLNDTSGMKKVIELFFQQEVKKTNNPIYNYALYELQVLNEAKVETAEQKIHEPGNMEARTNNIETFFDFMSGEYVADYVVSPLLRDIKESDFTAKIPKSSRELHFDAKILPAIRSCLFLMQPVLTGTHNDNDDVLDEYKDKCESLIDCGHQIGFNIPRGKRNRVYLQRDLSTTLTREKYQPVCDSIRNYSFIINQARFNYISTGRVCKE